MSIQVALQHRSLYRFERAVTLSPHEVRLRPAAHCRTPILSYSLNVTPERHFINWHQDAFGNHVARLMFPDRAEALEITVDLVADMRVINPFDFFVDTYAERYPFAYRSDLAQDLAPFLVVSERGPHLIQRVAGLRPASGASGTVEFLVNLVRAVRGDIRYLARMVPGVQDCEQTLQSGSGSCRDSAWLLVQILRHLGLAARFVSGYLIQLASDTPPIAGPPVPERDLADLHAWAEAYVPGAGWIGLDPTSGLLCGEGHIPLACTSSPATAAPVIGTVEPCHSRFEFAVSVVRMHEDPQTSHPYADGQWRAIDQLGRDIDAELAVGDVRLTQGGEPTFVATGHGGEPEWSTAALGPHKWRLAEQLAWRLRERFAPGAMMLYGQGKWYPGEPLPRWAIGLCWRADGEPVWRRPELIAGESSAADATVEDARRIAIGIAQALGFTPRALIDAYEDPLPLWLAEAKLPGNVASLEGALATEADREHLARTLERERISLAGFALPLRAVSTGPQPESAASWETSPWPLQREQLYLLPGNSAMGYRLPLASLPEFLPLSDELEPVLETVDDHMDLHAWHTMAEKRRHARIRPGAHAGAREVVRTALTVELRDGRISVFLPPLPRARDCLDLVAAIEGVAAELAVPVRLEGYAPAADARLKVLAVVPDPGVIEVNIPPSGSWGELVRTTFVLHEEARAVGLGTEKFMVDGRHTGTGGGNHVTLGGPTPADSPVLRRPDLLRSLIAYWQNHPALSYLFAGAFIGPTSQAPRVDEARDDALYELEIAFQQLALRQKSGAEPLAPALVDRLLRNLLVDLTGNTHRAEFCIDKLYSPDSPTGQMGIVELRAFEMQPHPQMSLAQMLLLRALFARFWKNPYARGLIRWGTQLHDRFMLPHFLAADIHDVVLDLQRAGYPFDAAWFAPFVEFRFPRYGTVVYDNIQLELRHALEPWNVLGEEVGAGGTSRYVDSSVERLQVRVTGLTVARHAVACNGRALPLHPTGVPGESVAGVRYRAWHPPSALHPTIGVHTPLVFDIVDTWSGRSVGGCTYHVSHPGGRRYDTVPVNAGEAEARRGARFWDHGHTPGPMALLPEPPNPSFPMTLDLRWLPA